MFLQKQVQHHPLAGVMQQSYHTVKGTLSQNKQS
jgi:hypothetical protein